MFALLCADIAGTHIISMTTPLRWLILARLFIKADTPCFEVRNMRVIANKPCVVCGREKDAVLSAEFFLRNNANDALCSVCWLEIVYGKEDTTKIRYKMLKLIYG